MHPQSIALLSLFVLALTAAPTQADQITVTSDKDNTLYEHPTEDLSNALGRRMFIGRTNQGAGLDKRRALVEFDLDSVIPAGSTINSVTLQLNMSKTQVGNRSATLHRVTMDWGEGTSNAGGGEGAGDDATSGDATWLFSDYPTTTWMNPGGDFVASASATTTVGSEGFYTWSSTQMAADVQAWVDEESTNHGWILIGDEISQPSAKRFDTREENDSTKRPRLTIDFTPPGNSGACCQGTDCSVITAAECATLGGMYLGDGTSCSPNPCGATGACCLDAGACTVTTELDCMAQGGVYQGDDTACTAGLCPVNLDPFVDALPLPGVAQPVSGSPGGAATYDITMTEFTQQLHSDLPPTTVWGYGGSYPGPTFEAWRDAPLTVRWINDLRDSLGNLRTSHFLPVDLCPHGPNLAGPSARTVVHVHGAHLPPGFDGYPEDTILPGQQVEYIYPNNQPPATLWYHDHALGITRLNVIMGLAGFYLIRDQFELDLGLPSGDNEIPLVFQDRTFREDGSIVYPALWEDEVFGDKVLVNGKVWPFLNVKKGKYRFRMLNGSNGRTYRLALSNGQSMFQIGTDSVLLPVPLEVTQVTLASGERADVVIDFEGLANGTEILLVNDAPAPFPGNPGVNVIPDTMKFIVQGGGGFTDPLPTTLRPVEELLESAAVRERQILMRKDLTDPCSGVKWLLNDLLWDDITEYPVLDTIEIWSFVNPTSAVHPMHLHLVLFQVLDRQPFTLQGEDVVPTGPRVPPDPSEEGWKDTVRALPGEITRVIARFEDYAGKYAYHCHILEHEDHEMMRQFQAVDSPGTPYCYGDDCPCGNDNPQAGCLTTLGKGGVLYSTGTASVGIDDLVLTAANLPPMAFGIPFMGPDMIAPVAFGDGLRCVGGMLHRFPVIQANAQGFATLGPGIVSLAFTTLPPSGHIFAGDTWNFQHWYRDPNGPCSTNFTATNALSITFEL